MLRRGCPQWPTLAHATGEESWSGRRESNPRHSAWEADTLPAELRPLSRATGELIRNAGWLQMIPLRDALSLSSLTTSISSFALSLLPPLSIFWLALVSIPVPQPPSHGFGGAPIGASSLRMPRLTLVSKPVGQIPSLHPIQPWLPHSLPTLAGALVSKPVDPQAHAAYPASAAGSRTVTLVLKPVPSAAKRYLGSLFLSTFPKIRSPS